MLTLTALIVLGSLATYGIWRNFKKTNALKAPLIPWMFVAMACIATCFMLIVHLVNLIGIETGR